MIPRTSGVPSLTHAASISAADLKANDGMTGPVDSLESLLFVILVTARKHRASGPSCFRIVSSNSVTPGPARHSAARSRHIPEAGVTRGRRRVGDVVEPGCAGSRVDRGGHAGVLASLWTVRRKVSVGR